MTGIVSVRHGGLLRHVPSRGRNARTEAVEAHVPARLRDVSARDLGQPVACTDGHGTRVSLATYDGAAWLPIEGASAQIRAGELRAFIETGNPGPMFYGMGKGAFNGTPLMPTLHPDTGVADIAPHRRSATIHEDERDRAAQAAARFVEEELLIAGGLAYARLPGPVVSWTDGIVLGRHSLCLYPRQYAHRQGLGSLLCGLDEAPAYREACVPDRVARPLAAAAFRGSIDGILPRDREAERALLVDALPARILILLRNIEANWSTRPDGAAARDAADTLRPWAVRGGMGTVRPSERSELLALCAAALETVTARLPRPFFDAEVSEAHAVVTSWIPRLMGAPIELPPEDADAFEGLAP